MSHKLRNIQDHSGLYRLESDQYLNNYYIISNEQTCRLMASPEVVGFDCYKAMLAPTVEALKALEADVKTAAILTILRGGLNYPLEECCFEAGIRVNNINFLSCERVIECGVITGLDVKYEKLHPEKDCTLMIGDIIASGDTLRLCMRYFIEYFRANGGSIKKIVFFTIGGTRAIPLMEEETRLIREIWPEFEGFDCIFYEGMFTVYTDKGVTGVNIPMIDFGWKDATISPEFREYILDYKYAPALLEKCIIYDGGARRYEIEEHYAEVRGYWEDLLRVSPFSSMDAFLAEKVGYDNADYKQWLEINNYPEDAGLEALYQKEQDYIANLMKQNLTKICESRLEQLNTL